jgi:hypothetical protein
VANPAYYQFAMYPALDELKTHLRGSGIVLRSKTPDLARISHQVSTAAAQAGMSPVVQVGSPLYCPPPFYQIFL